MKHMPRMRDPNRDAYVTPKMAEMRRCFGITPQKAAPAETKTLCLHNFQEYIGFRESYWFCTRCDQKTESPEPGIFITIEI